MQFASLNKYRGKAHCFHVHILRSKFCLLHHDSQSRPVLKYHLRLLICQCLWFQHLENQCIWYARLNGFLSQRVLRLHSLIYTHPVIQYIYLPYRWWHRQQGLLLDKALVPILKGPLLGSLSGNVGRWIHLNLVILIMQEFGRLNSHLLMRSPHVLVRYRIKQFLHVHLVESCDLNGR